MASDAASNGHLQNGDGAANDLERNAKASGESKWRFSVVIEDFQFLWFTLSMNTGILSILLHQLPYGFNGMGVLSTILFVFNLVMFISMFIMMSLRVVMFPKTVAKSLKTDITELSMTGAVTIAWFTLVGQVGLTVSTAHWGGHPWFLVAYVMWWIGTFVMFCTTIFVFSVVVSTGVTNTKSLGPPLAVPFVGTATNAVVGALIVSYSDGVNARLAIPVIVVSYLLCGLGIWAGILVFSLIWSRFMDRGPTPPAQSPGLFLLVAPPGQVAAAVILLGYASSLHFGAYDRGTFFNATSGTTLSTVGIFFGLLVLGLSVFFIFFALYTIIDLAFRRQHSYSLIWWSTIFPLATVDTAFIGLATSMNSPTFEVLAEGLFLILFIVYVINAGFTLMQIAQGKLLSGRRKEDEKEK